MEVISLISKLSKTKKSALSVNTLHKGGYVYGKIRKVVLYSPKKRSKIEKVIRKIWVVSQ